MKKITQFIRRHKVWVISTTLIFLTVAAVLITELTPKDTKENAGTSTTGEVTRGNISSTVTASGTIETANYLAVTTSVNGIVKKVYVQEGDIVTKGQKIMEITLNADGEESRLSAYASYLSAKSNLEKAKNELLSKESLLINTENAFEDEKEENSYQTRDERESYKLAENSYLVAKSEYERQKEAIVEAEVSLNKAWLSYQAQSPTIIAPDSGIIANILVVEGMEISNSLSERTSSTVASIRKEGTPIASLNITEVDINKIKVGQKVVLTLDSIDDKKFTGKVAGIDKIGSTLNGVSNYPVIIKFDENSDMVLPNMGVDADVIIEEKENVLLVPTSAIETKDGEKAVTVLRDGSPRKTLIEIGISDDKFTEVISGLQEGDAVQIKSLPIEGFDTTEGNRNERVPGVGGFIR